MQRKGIIIATATTLALLAIGTFLLASSLKWEEKKQILLNVSFNVPGNSYEYRTASISISGCYVASFNVSNGILKFFPFDEATFPMWQEGQFDPWWVETDHADYGMDISLGTEGKNYLDYFLFLNEDSADKEVSLQVARVWEELNYVGLLSGATLILAGMIICIVVIYKLR